MAKPAEDEKGQKKDEKGEGGEKEEKGEGGEKEEIGEGGEKEEKGEGREKEKTEEANAAEAEEVMKPNDEFLFDDPEEEHYAITPPNGGWGWVVVFCAFYCNVVVDGIQLTFGIFLKPISTNLRAEVAEVALAGSLMFGVHLLIGPICAGCNNVFGLRPVTIMGSLICCFGVGISYFMTSHWCLYFSFGIIGGAGLGLVYMNSLVITSLYFTSLMPLAIAIVVCGTGIGTIVFAALGDFLLSVTTWQNSFLMEAALAGSMGIASIAFKPLKPVKVKISRQRSSSRRRSSSRPRTSFHIATSSRKKKAMLLRREVPSRLSRASVLTYQSFAWSLAENVVAKDLRDKSNRKCEWCKCCGKKKELIDSDVLVLSEIKKDDHPLHTFGETYVEKDQISETESDEILEPHKIHSSTSYRTIFTRIDVEEEKLEKKKFCDPLKKTIVTMLDFRLLKSFSFCLFTVSGAIQVAAVLIVFIYEKDRAEQLGFADNSSAYFIMALGGANVFWRLFLGGFATILKINYKALTISGIVIGGIATMTSGYWENIYYQFLFCFLFALAMASFAVFRVTFLVDLVGLDLVATATGINLMFMGVLCIVSPPIFGLIMAASKSYNIVFLLTGVLIVASGFMLIGLKKVDLEKILKTDLVINR